MTNSSSAAKTSSKTPSNGSSTAGDQPYFDPTAYGNGPDDSIDATQTDENAAITHHSAVIGGKTIDYTATAGHLVIVDPSSSKPDAKLFYVAFTQDNQTEESRRSRFSITAVRDRRRYSCCLGPSLRNGSRPRRPRSRRPRLTRWRTTRTACWTRVISCSSTRSARVIQRRLHRTKTSISGALTRTQIRLSN